MLRMEKSDICIMQRSINVIDRKLFWLVPLFRFKPYFKIWTSIKLVIVAFPNNLIAVLKSIKLVEAKSLCVVNFIHKPKQNRRQFMWFSSLFAGVPPLTLLETKTDVINFKKKEFKILLHNMQSRKANAKANNFRLKQA